MKDLLIKIVLLAIPQLLKLLSAQMIKDLIDKILDYVEERVMGSASEIDDALVLPITDLLREAMNVPDND